MSVVHVWLQSSVIEMLLDENPVKNEESVSEVGSTSDDCIQPDGVNNDCLLEHPGQTVLCNYDIYFWNIILHRFCTVADYCSVNFSDVIISGQYGNSA